MNADLDHCSFSGLDYLVEAIAARGASSAFRTNARIPVDGVRDLPIRRLESPAQQACLMGRRTSPYHGFKDAWGRCRTWRERLFGWLVERRTKALQARCGHETPASGNPGVAILRRSRKACFTQNWQDINTESERASRSVAADCSFPEGPEEKDRGDFPAERHAFCCVVNRTLR
ncbi:hypothetical protein [Caballeronia sp. J97]|uniref:hypothetical protein n=1 Tax=Caballeronia sp. J97 TaxID=2805429 RepID=UPI002AB11095|nr:hypothetical protein [Caballeronia sp. J97]